MTEQPCHTGAAAHVCGACAELRRELDAADDNEREQKVECPILTCPSSFIAPASALQLVQHVVRHHPELINWEAG